ncbi:MAG TPA: GYD domain-containing protein [Kiritimatiellia bacterium]|nr:GYD domain-containing protein [Kiritimatiellia bacterium]HMP35409.1 GYD domain-containing protein [Kiritimatiellia bacterium]
MALYLMLGNYTHPSVREINAARTKEAVGVIEKNNGQVVSMYAMLGQFDVVLVVNLPGNREAMEVSVGLSRVTGIHFSTGPVIPIDRFDEMMETARQAQEQMPTESKRT